MGNIREAGEFRWRNGQGDGRWCGTVGSDVCLVGHEDDVVEIVQEVDDVLKAVSGRILRVGVACGFAHQRTHNMVVAGVRTKRSIVEEDDVVQCIFESLVVAPHFAQGRLMSDLSARGKGGCGVGGDRRPCFCGRGRFWRVSYVRGLRGRVRVD